MGNTPSTSSHKHSSSSTSHESSKTPSSTSTPTTSTPTTNPTRRDHPRNLINSQRTAAAEPSLTQARGTTATHRSRNSQSIPIANLSQTTPSQPINNPSHQSSDPHMGAQQSKESKVKKVDTPDQPSKPVDVPIPVPSSNEPSSSRSHSQSIEPSGSTTLQDMSYHLTRPPRLPLPIEEEVHTPGSPIIAPTDVGADIIDAPNLDIDPLDPDTLPRRASAISNTTIDEEDAEELRVDKTGATVPTVFEWKRGGEKVYVTGTIFQWNKKHRLHPVEGQPGLLRATINVRPGTHHVRFIVDSVMQCSQDLPTTVDFGNNLVNYIEVSADDLPQEPPRVPAPNIPASQGEQKPTEPPKPVGQDDTKVPKPTPKTKPALSSGRYSRQIPQYLVDLDKPEDSPAYHYASTAIEKFVNPPSLPLFLAKPILNVPAPVKDDNSVLTMPNHTVLNHLATSSIKNNILAVSATTRYKAKYVTTIMYQPTGEE